MYMAREYLFFNDVKRQLKLAHISSLKHMRDIGNWKIARETDWYNILFIDMTMCAHAIRGNVFDLSS